MTTITTLKIVLQQWKLMLIGLLLFMWILACVCISQLKHDKVVIQNKFESYVQEVQKKELQNKLEQTEKALETSQTLIQIEVKHNAEIKQIASDLVNANSAVNSLSESLADANTRAVKAETGQVRAYASELSNILTECNGRYIQVAEKADEHRANEAAVKEKYNALVDLVNNNYNK